MKRLLLALAFLFIAAPAWAQNPTCPTRPYGDSTNACASTAFVQSASSGGLIIPITAYGAVCNGTTNDSTAIQNAIDYAASVGGAKILFPGRTCAISTGLTISSRNIILDGVGDGSPISNNGMAGNTGYGSQLKWTGTAGQTMLQIASPTNGQILGGIGVVGISFNCNNSAAIGLQLLSVAQSNFEGVSYNECTGRGIHIYTKGPLASTEPNNTQYNNFTRISGWTISSSGVGIELDGDSSYSGNANHNYFNNLQLVQLNGKGILIRNGDNNMFANTGVFRGVGGTGIGIELSCNLTSNVTANGNSFQHLSLQSTNPLIARGTETCVTATYANSIFMLDSTNSAPAPTVGTGATINWQYDNGRFASRFLLGATYTTGGIETTGVSVTQTGNATQDAWGILDGTTGNSWYVGLNRTGSRYGYLAYDNDGLSRVLRLVWNNVGLGIGSAVVPTYGLVVGADLGTIGAIPVASTIVAGNAAEDSYVIVGQDSTHNLQIKWGYNATAGNAVAAIQTFGYSNPIDLDASIVAVGRNSSAPLNAYGAVRAYTGTAIPAGGTAGAGHTFFSTSNFGLFGGSGVPTLAAAQGSLYARSDGLPYYNTNGSTTWVQLVDLSTSQTLTNKSIDASQLTGTVASARISGSYTGITGVGTLTAGATGAGFTIALSTSTVTGTLPAAQMPALTGDITTSAGAVATTLATVNSNVGSFGSSTAIPTFTVNAKGLVTAASTAVVVAPAGTLSGTTLASGVTASSLTSVGTIATGVWNAGAVTSTGTVQGSGLAAVNTQANATVNATDTTLYSTMKFQEAGVDKAAVQFINSAFGTVGRRSNLEFYNNAGGPITFYPNGTLALTLAASGAATFASSITIASATMIATTTPFTNGAGASAGTIANAPSVGNPTKWIPVNDNGTTRYIPAW